MDTKLTGSKRGKVIGIIVSILVVLSLSAGFVAMLPMLSQWQEQRYGKSNYFEQYEFIEKIHRSGFAMYWQALKASDTNIAGPDDLLYPGYKQRVEWDDQDDESYAYKWDYARYINNRFNDWIANLNYDWGNYDCFIRTDNGISYGDGERLGHFTEMSDMEKQAEYRYYAVIHFDKRGEMTVNELHGASMDAYTDFKGRDLEWRLTTGFNATVEDYGNMADITPFTVFFAVPGAVTGYDVFADSQYYLEYERFVYYSGTGGLFIMMLLAAAAAALILSRVKAFALLSARGSRIPFEIAVTLIIIVLCFFGSHAVFENLFSAQTGRLLRGFEYTGIPTQTLDRLGQLLAYGFIVLLTGTTFISILSVSQVFRLKLRYLKELTLIGRFGRRIFRICRWIYRGVTKFDLSSKGTKTILKIIALNFAVVMLLCFMWFFGLLGLIAYTVILYFVLRRIYNDLSRKYQTLLAATRGMADGQLDIRTDEDLGVFEPMKNELEKIQRGFSKAVEEETKSQRMKTELITNVSHDLKTPLTAIITYVDLLKKEDVTEEERRSYIETLDVKTQRLKNLIEDLFEMSKASSRDVTLNLARIDLPELIRQVEMETHDLCAAAGLEFRYSIQPGLPMLWLDGGKTSRIFENLLLNAAKYAMPNTRVYIEIAERNGWVVTQVKNVSRDVLDFDTEEITERFVRGDRSRNTEGSGLGLAIARSFTELQKGMLAVETDGDLFKVTISFAAE